MSGDCHDWTPEAIRARAVNNEGYTGHLWPQYDVAQELADLPIGPHMLADNEVDDYLALERVLHRHAFHEHDCQSVGCVAMFVLDSPEFTEILRRVYERGQADPKSSPHRLRADGSCATKGHHHA